MLHNTKIKLKHLLMRVKEKRNKRKMREKKRRKKRRRKGRRIAVGGWNWWPAVGGWKRREGLAVGGNIVSDRRFRLHCREGLRAGLCGPTAGLGLAGLAWVWPAIDSDDDIFFIFYFNGFCSGGLDVLIFFFMDRALNLVFWFFLWFFTWIRRLLG
jgi:hypothetical protein